jgi:5-methylcytosine-specific restriction endonuclease McrA
MMIDGWEQRPCTQCGKHFAAKRSANQGMCSLTCRDEALRVRDERTCDHCGITYSRQPSDHRGQRSYCGTECRVAGWTDALTVYATDEERIAAQRDRARRWAVANPDRVREKSRRYYERNKGKLLEMARSARKRARSKGSVRLETIHRDVLWERDGGTCHLCGKPCDPADWHADHIIPRSQGGVTSYANMAVSHPFCNMSKGAKAVGDQLRIL